MVSQLPISHSQPEQIVFWEHTVKVLCTKGDIFLPDMYLRAYVRYVIPRLVAL